MQRTLFYGILVAGILACAGVTFWLAHEYARVARSAVPAPPDARLGGQDPAPPETLPPDPALDALVVAQAQAQAQDVPGRFPDLDVVAPGEPNLARYQRLRHLAAADDTAALLDLLAVVDGPPAGLDPERTRAKTRAVAAMGRMTIPEARSLVLRLAAEHDDPRVRLAAINVLAAWQPEGAREVLAAILAEDASPLIRAKAQWAQTRLDR